MAFTYILITIISPIRVVYQGDSLSCFIFQVLSRSCEASFTFCWPSAWFSLSITDVNTIQIEEPYEPFLILHKATLDLFCMRGERN